MQTMHAAPPSSAQQQPATLAAAAPSPAAPRSASATPSASTDASSGSQAVALPLRPKSAKRRAAESLLERRFSCSDLAAAGAAAAAAAAAGGPAPATRQCSASPAAARPPVAVPACSDCAAGGQAAAAWCSQDVALPPMDWAAVLQSVQHEGDVGFDTAAQCYRLPGGIRVHVVSSAAQLGAALAALRASMQDGCVAVDLEWRPEGWAGNGPSRVALMQLASATTAVLVRFSQLGFRMPPALRTFLSDPELTFVGFSWDGSDETKMRSTFGAGRALFSRLLDLQQIAAALGYHGYGLGALTRQVLGFQPPKCRKVTMSNWEARQLSAKQVQYAALDAVITGTLYRGLRLWHASPSACTSCRQMLGAALPVPTWHCHDCDRDFQSSGALASHRHQKQHRCSPATCAECGRVHLTDGEAAAAAPSSKQQMQRTQ